MNDFEPTSLTDEVIRLRAENDTLRALLGNSALPCSYCGLAAEDQAKCARGFPGCARADDQMLAKHFADGFAVEQYAKANLKLVGEVRKLRAALIAISRMYDENDPNPMSAENQAAGAYQASLETLVEFDLTCLGLPEVSNIEAARRWFLNNSTGSCLGVIRARKTGEWHDTDLGDIVQMAELSNYPEALVFFDLA